MGRLVSALAAVALLGGCGERPPDLAPRISASERAIGEEQHPQLLAQFGGAYDGDEASYVRAVGERISAAAGLAGECTFTLVNSDVVNAFAVPGCYIYVTRGLFAVMTSEAELASVLGHEIGHIVGRHSQRQQRRSLWRSLGVLAAGLTGSETLARLAGRAAQYFTQRYSRAQEYEADTLGVRYLQASDYDVFAAAEMLSALGRNEAYMAASNGHDAARSIPEWALSHPLTENRIARAREAAGATGLADDAQPERADAYLAAVDGLLYGDDPEQGFVLGRRFAHPVMRIAFEAPPGFTLTNSPRAIGISGPGGIAGEFGGGQMPAGGLEAYAEALAQHIGGQAPVEIVRAERRRINNLAAAVVTLTIQGRDGAVPLAIAAYDAGGGAAYHFLAVVPPSADIGALDALFGSFRLLSTEEASALRPRVIRTVPVRSGDTLGTMSARMAADDPRALFLMLNGRTPEQPLRPGERVKLVTYAVAR